MIEEWKTIEDYPNYMVSNMGNVKSLNYKRTGEERIMKGRKSKNGYLQVCLYKDGKGKNYLVHRLVAQAFIPNPNNLPEINHKDEDKTNNRVDNLEYCDRSYNVNFGSCIERMAKSLSIPILQFTKQGEFIRRWENTIQVERELGINKSSINECCRGRRKTCGGYRWCYHYKSLWLKKHIPLIKQKKVA